MVKAAEPVLPSAGSADPPGAITAAASQSAYMIGHDSSVTIMSAAAAFGPSKALPGKVTSVAEEGGFTFVAFEAAVPGASRVPVGNIVCIHGASEVPVRSAALPYAHRSAVLAMDCAPGPAGVPILFSGSADGGLCMWTHAAGAWSRHPMGDGHARAVSTVRFVAAPVRVLTGSFDCTVALWDPSHLEAPVQVLFDHADPIVSARAFRDATMAGFVSADSGGNLAVWRFDESKSAVGVEKVGGFAKNPLTSMEVVEVPGGPNPVIVVGNRDGSVSARLLTSGLGILAVRKPAKAHARGPVVIGKALPGTPGVLTGGADGKIACWNLSFGGGAAAGGPAAALPAHLARGSSLPYP